VEGYIRNIKRYIKYRVLDVFLIFCSIKLPLFKTDLRQIFVNSGREVGFKRSIGFIGLSDL